MKDINQELSQRLIELQETARKLLARTEFTRQEHQMACNRWSEAQGDVERCLKEMAIESEVQRRLAEKGGA